MTMMMMVVVGRGREFLCVDFFAMHGCVGFLFNEFCTLQYLILVLMVLLLGLVGPMRSSWVESVHDNLLGALNLSSTEGTALIRGGNVIKINSNFN